MARQNHHSELTRREVRPRGSTSVRRTLATVVSSSATPSTPATVRMPSSSPPLWGWAWRAGGRFACSSAYSWCSSPRSGRAGGCCGRSWASAESVAGALRDGLRPDVDGRLPVEPLRSEEHTSELQSRPHLVCRLLLEKKKKTLIRFFYIQKKKKNTS